MLFVEYRVQCTHQPPLDIATIDKPHIMSNVFMSGASYFCPQQ